MGCGKFHVLGSSCVFLFPSRSPHSWVGSIRAATGVSGSQARGESCRICFGWTLLSAVLARPVNEEFQSTPPRSTKSWEVFHGFWDEFFRSRTVWDDPGG